MVTFACDDSRVETALRRLCSLVVANGGTIDEGLTILCRAGHLSVEAPKRMSPGKRIIFLPEACFVPLQKGRLSLAGNRIVINTRTKPLAGVRGELLEAMVRIFNLTGKIAHQKRETVVGLIHRAPDLAKAILRCRSYKNLHSYRHALRLTPDDFILEELMASRALFLPDAQPAKRGPYLLPIVDCINHHAEAEWITPAYDRGRRVGAMVENRRSGAGSAECQVLYGHYDAADSLILHHFVDRRARFVRSVPMTVAIPDVGALAISSRIEIFAGGKLPAALEDIRAWLPRIGGDARKRRTTASFLLIPQRDAPMALRQVLALAIAPLVRESARLERAVLLAEREVIRENVRHYRGLLAYLDAFQPTAATYRAAENARTMAESQLANIARYPFFRAALTGQLNAGDKDPRRSRTPPA